MNTTQKKQPTPQTASTEEEVIQLNRTYIDDGGFSMLVEAKEVHIYGAGSGDISRVSMPKKVFDKFVEMYLNG